MIYLDNAATTKVAGCAINAMVTSLNGNYGNPSNIHSKGVEAKSIIQTAKQNVRELLNASALDQIVFTSGGTEANNLAIHGMTSRLKKIGLTTIVLSAIEHPSVYEACQTLERDGFNVIEVPVDQYGVIDLLALRNIFKRNNVGLVSVMSVNNETGAIQPIEEIGALCWEYRAYFHTDAVQAIGHIDVDVEESKIDLLTFTGHKIHAPKGIGVLYVRRDTPLKKIIDGGHQGNNLRPGTENVPGIVAIDTALKRMKSFFYQDNCLFKSLRNAFFTRLFDLGVKFTVNADGISSIISLTLPGFESESMLLILDSMGICVSSGSACNSGNHSSSRVLMAMGLTERDASCTIRISMSKFNSKKDMIACAEGIARAIEQMKQLNNEIK